MKKLKQMAALGSLLVGSGVVVAQDSIEELDSSLVEIDHSMYQTFDKKTEDEAEQKAFGSGDYFLFLSASGATKLNSSTAYTYTGAGCIRPTAAATYEAFDMSVQIPDGHRIRGFRYYWYDNDSSANSTANLFKFDDNGDPVMLSSQQVSADSSGYGNAYNGFSTPHTVNNSDGSYVIRFETTTANANIRMCGVRLFISS